MPESMAVLATEVGGWFAADAALGGVAGLSAEEAAGMGIVGAGTGELSAAEAAAVVGGGAGASAAPGMGIMGGLDPAFGEAGLSFGPGEAVAPLGAGALDWGAMSGGAGAVPPAGVDGFGTAPVGAASPDVMGQAMAGAGGTSAVQPAPTALESIFGPKGSLATLFGKGGMGANILQTASGAYGLINSMRALQMARQPNRLGEQAIKRSMASQGYQGSGNMAAALGQYGMNGSIQASQAMQGPLTGAMSSLGLITSGLSGFGG